MHPESPMPGPPPRHVVLAYARRAVAEEYANPYHGHMTDYDNQSVLNAVLNHFNGEFIMGGAPLALEVDRDEDLIREVVREAEQEFNRKNNIEL
jgi:hypothetical protein